MTREEFRANCMPDRRLSDEELKEMVLRLVEDLSGNRLFLVSVYGKAAEQLGVTENELTPFKVMQF